MKCLVDFLRNLIDSGDNIIKDRIQSLGLPYIDISLMVKVDKTGDMHFHDSIEVDELFVNIEGKVSVDKTPNLDANVSIEVESLSEDNVSGDKT